MKHIVLYFKKKDGDLVRVIEVPYKLSQKEYDELEEVNAELVEINHSGVRYIRDTSAVQP